MSNKTIDNGDPILENQKYAKSKGEYLFKMLFERTFDPFALYRIVCDKSGHTCDVRFMDVNPAYERVMGVKKEEVIGKKFTEIWPHAEKYWIDIILRTAKTNVTAKYEGESSDTGKYLEAIAFPSFPGEVAVIFLDRTEWRKSDEKLRKSEKMLLQYREELRELAAQMSLTEAETRRKIAGNIHDKIGYSLIQVLHKMQGIRSTSSDPEILKKIEDAIVSVEHVITESRQLTFETASPLLYDVGLNAALESLADQILSPHNIGFDFQGGHLEHQADTTICILLFEMTRELLINVVKHSGASFVNLRVHRNPNKIRVVVEDNGKGFPPRFNRKLGQMQGFGLFSIRERLLPIGGNIQLFSEKEKGATVVLEAPTREKHLLEEHR